MPHDPEIFVTVTGHAIVRFRERYPDEGRHDSAKLAIWHLTVHAIREGRFSKNVPTWATWVSRQRHDRARFAWDPDETIAFALRQLRAKDFADPTVAHGFRHRYTVTTILPHHEHISGSDKDARDLMRFHIADLKRRARAGARDLGQRYH